MSINDKQKTMFFKKTGYGFSCGWTLIGIFFIVLYGIHWYEEKHSEWSLRDTYKKAAPQ